MELAEGVHHFTDFRFNWYLVEEGNQLTVVDSGFAGHYRLLEQGLAQIGRALADIEAIVVTHAHTDHTGFAPRLARVTGAPIYLHVDDAANLRRSLFLPWIGLLSHVWRPYTAAMLAHAGANGVLSISTIADALPMGDADVLDVPGRPRVVHLPGHTPGEAVLHLPGRGVLFSGDALVTRDLYTGRDTEPRVPGAGLNSNREEALAKLGRITGLGETTMLPGHGEPWQGSASDAIAGAREAAARKRTR